MSAGTITTVAGNGNEGFSGDGGPATSAWLDAPTGVAVDSAGNLYIADEDNDAIRKVSGGTITTVAGNGSAAAFSGDGGPAISASLGAPNGVAVDSAGNLYIADTYNDRIRKVSNGTITTVAGNGNYGFSGDGGPATSASLDSPQRSSRRFGRQPIYRRPIQQPDSEGVERDDHDSCRKWNARILWRRRSRHQRVA